MEPNEILPSTTSHKTEPLVPTLEVFSRLGWRDLDLNLHHLLEANVPLDIVRATLAAGGQRVPVVSGGWCDFFHSAPRVEDTFRSVARQVMIARTLGADRLRLFFGRLSREQYSRDALVIVANNLRRLSTEHPDILFVFENHDGASLDPAVCREVVETVARPNIRINFDPINFERAHVPGADALRELQPFIGHVHLKGLEDGQYCEFGVGDVDLLPVLRSLMAGGYCGAFTVEYEGPFDGTVRLYQSLQRARAVLRGLTARSIDDRPESPV
jgi:sugar phosphate isomerase/epimerase